MMAFVKDKFVLWLALGLVCTPLGCSTATRSFDIVSPHDRGGIQLPVRLAGYQELYTFIADHEGFPTDSNSLLKLAADSETQLYGLDQSPDFVWVITPHFYDGGKYDKIRGATGNGGIYVIRPLARDFISPDTDHGFEVIGVAGGNSLRWSSLNGITRLATSWHVSAAEQPETVYTWNGRFFEPLKWPLTR